jgi:SAM-dependent methyltransferase
VAVNRAYWDESAPDWVAMGERAWASSEPSWGIWGIPESELEMVPDDMAGMDAIELGCGTAYWSAWMARRGARVVGIDNSEQQLVTARRLAAEHGVELELIHGNAETVPYPDESFDFALSEYGASLWADPEVWAPEAWRLLRPGGVLVFLTNHPLAVVTSPLDGSLPIGDRLVRPYFGLRREDWRDAIDDPGGIEFHRTISDWFELLTGVGFVVDGLHELQSPEGGEEINFFVTADWAHRWPSEMLWKVRKKRRDPSSRT